MSSLPSDLASTGNLKYTWALKLETQNICTYMYCLYIIHRDPIYQYTICSMLCLTPTVYAHISWPPICQPHFHIQYRLLEIRQEPRVCAGGTDEISRAALPAGCLCAALLSHLTGHPSHNLPTCST